MLRMMAIALLPVTLVSAADSFAAPRLVVLEEVTNSAALRTDEVQSLLEAIQRENPDVIRVSYHGWWPGHDDAFYLAAPEDIRHRITSRGMRSVPSVAVNGIRIRGGVTSESVVAAIRRDRSEGSPLAIQLRVQPEVRGWRAAISVTSDRSPGPSGLTIHYALVESFDGPSMVYRGALGYPDGVPAPAGAVFAHETTFEVPGSCDLSHCSLLVTIEDASHEVVQAAVAPLSGELVTSSGIQGAPESFAFSIGGSNPAGNGSTIRFALPTPAPVHVAIYDVQGREVKVLIDRPMTPGRFVVAWGLDDNAGNRVSPGVYMARIVAGGWSDHYKIIVGQ